MLSIKHSWEKFEPKSAPSEVVKRKKKRNVSETHQSFLRCKEYLLEHPDFCPNSEKWAEYFGKCYEGVLPTKCHVSEDTLICNTTRGGSKIHFSSDIGALCGALIGFFKKNDKYLPIIEPKKAKASSSPVNSMTWTEARKRVALRNQILRMYVNEQCTARGISECDSNSILFEIIHSIEVKGLDISGVVFEEGRISSFPSITFNGNSVSFVKFKSLSPLKFGTCENINGLLATEELSQKSADNDEF